MITMIVIALALSAVLLFYVAARSRSKQAGLRPVDIVAFRTLMERDDELFLRARLPGAKFAGLKRQRIRVTLGYVGRIADNAAVVLRLAEPARHSQDPEVAQAAAQVMEMATNIRLQCLVAVAKLCAEFAVPSLQLTPALLAPKYQTLRENVLRLGALQTQNVSPLASAI